jgi:hypothetical protein
MVDDLTKIAIVIIAKSTPITTKFFEKFLGCDENIKAIKKYYEEI